MPRQILHVDMDAFFVSIEELLDPSLKGRPVIVGGRAKSRGVVAAANYEARKFGVHSALPLRTASRLCPQASFLPVRHDLYGEYSERIHQIFSEFSPVVEMVSIDEAYLDLTGCERLYGSALRAADRLIRQVREKIGLPCSIGIATSKLVAKIASDQAKPRGLLWVLPGCEKQFLNPLPIRKVPGVGKVTEPQIKALGIRTIGDVQQVNRKTLIRKFGRFGEWLFLKAQGKDTGAYEYSEVPQSISHETTFSEDTNHAETLERTLSYLCQRVARRLREHGLFARTLGLKLRYADFQTITRAETLPQPTQLDSAIFATVRALWERSRRRKAKIRLLGVQATQLWDTPGQLNLLSRDSEGKRDRIFQAADRVRDRYGFGVVQLARSLEPVQESRKSPPRGKTTEPTRPKK